VSTFGDSQRYYFFPETQKKRPIFFDETFFLEGVKVVKVVKGVKEPPVPPPIGGGQGEA
jgi:hypothetical protein